MAPPSKKRKLKDTKTEEVVFDPSARFEYLTGFHKRKVQRTKQAQEAAAQRARQDKIDERKKLREERKAELDRHVQQVNSMLPTQNVVAESDTGSQEDENNDDNENWEGIPENIQDPVDHEDEYIDEDKYTTVTVEEVNISRHGISRLGNGSEEPEADTDKKLAQETSVQNKKQRPVSNKRFADKDKKPKKKKKNFRYESPAERKLNRTKERAKKSKAARIRRGD